MPIIKFSDDSLLHSTVQYYSIPLLYLIGYITSLSQSPPMHILTFIFFVIPLCDEFIQHDTKNPTPEEARKLENKLSFKLPLYISVFCDYFMTYKMLGYLTETQLPIFLQWTILFAHGVVGGSHINIAHELLHKESCPLDSFMGSLALAKVMYQHFIIEHIYGHHRNVATPVDPATAKRGQSVYSFWPQTLVGSFKSAWSIEASRLKKKGSPIWSLENQMLRYQINNVAAVLIVFYLFGAWGVFYYLNSTIMSILFLETVNYIEHYGLKRKEIAPGVYEKVTIEHSWNAPHRFTNYLLFKLQRHSDHHENSLKPYQVLLTQERSPTLPNGYALCTIMALFPPIWKNVMEDMLDLLSLPIEKRKKSPQWVRARTKVRLFIAFLGLVCILGLYVTHRTTSQLVYDKVYLSAAMGSIRT